MVSRRFGCVAGLTLAVLFAGNMVAPLPSAHAHGLANAAPQLVRVKHVSGPEAGFLTLTSAVTAHDPSCCQPCCDPCQPPIKQTLTFCHPCTCCDVCVDVCLPACCTGEPCVTCRPTLFGCGLIRYDWCCGYSVIVRFQRCGDVRVIYRDFT